MIEEIINVVGGANDLHNGNKNGGELFWVFLAVIGGIVVLISMIVGV